MENLNTISTVISINLKETLDTTHDLPAMGRVKKSMYFTLISLTLVWSMSKSVSITESDIYLRNRK